jgi:hypothetical protein
MKKLFVAATLGLALVSCGGPSVCDCAQMSKDIMKEARLNHYYFRADRIATHATATARQLFTADGRLIKGGN